MPEREARRVRPPWWIWPLLLALGVAGLVGWIAGCSGWDPTEPFERNAPDVDRAIELMDGGQFESAAEVLESYLGTGPCGDGGIGLPPAVREKPNGSFDLGLTLFYLAEKYGQRFGDEELADAGPEQEELDEKRSLEIDCAQIIVKAIAADPKVIAELRARAYYLSGNLEFLRKQYEDAVRQYDQALEIVPGLMTDGGDGIGRDAAHNRAIALRRIQEQDAGPPDAEPDAQPDAEPDAQPDAQPDAEPDEQDSEPDAGEDGGDNEDQPDGGGGGQDGGEDSGAPDAGEDGGNDQQDPDREPPPADDEPRPLDSQNPQIDRILDELEEAPTYQEQDAKQRAARRGGRRVMEDK